MMRLLTQTHLTERGTLEGTDEVRPHAISRRCSAIPLPKVLNFTEGAHIKIKSIFHTDEHLQGYAARNP